MSDTDITVEVSTEDVEASRERVANLRNELEQVNKDLAVSEASRTNAVKKARLDVEAESLEQQLQAARDRLAVSQGEDSDMPSSGDRKSEWEEYAQANQIDTTGMTKAQIEEAVRSHKASVFTAGPVREQAHVNLETGEVNPEEVERLTDASNEDED